MALLIAFWQGECTVTESQDRGQALIRIRRKGETIMEQAKTKSVEPQQRFALPEVTWDDRNEPGAYVERGSGDLYRIPKEGLIPGGSPIVHKESIGSSR